MDALYGKELSLNFTAREFRCRGEDEGKPCACHGAIQADQRLVDVLQVFRSLVGSPVSLTSGFRCDTYNDAIGGHARSYHRIGQAADLTSVQIRNQLSEWGESLGEVVEDVIGEGNGNVIVYHKKKIIHVDVGSRVAVDLVRENG